MRRLIGSGVCLVLVVGSGEARAQAAGPSAPAADAPAAAESNAEEAADDESDDTPPKPRPEAKKSPSESAIAETESSKEMTRLPPPPPPRADEQEPRPYLYTFRPSTMERHIELGPDAGIWFRNAKGSTVDYAPGFAWGLHARADLWEHLSLSAYFNRAQHSVDIPRGSLGLADTDVNQPALQVTQVGGRVEPTLRPITGLRLWLGLGVAWGHILAEAPSMSGANAATYADRTGVYLEYSAALGATWEAIPSWLAISLSASGGVLTNQSGDVFYDHQAVSNDGTLVRLAALPELESSYAALLGVGILL